MSCESYPPAVWDGTTEMLESVVDLKTRYCRWIDGKDWDRVASLFLPHAVLQFGPSDASAIRGRLAIVRFLRRQLGQGSTLHEARDPELRAQEGDSVRVVWSMKDHVETPLYRLEGAGFYEDLYEQTAVGWKVAQVRVHRSKVVVQPQSFVMRGLLHAHDNGWLERVAPGIAQTFSEALHVGLRPGERP